jgi:hypothetical protein
MNLVPIPTTEIVLYQFPGGSIKIDVVFENETVWLTQEQMAELFGKARKRKFRYTTWMSSFPLVTGSNPDGLRNSAFGQSGGCGQRGLYNPAHFRLD